MRSPTFVAALEYAAKHWAVFPVHGVINGACTCQNPECKSPGKHPRTANGFKDASFDPTVIGEWWDKYPDSNIGIATGEKSGIGVVDVDPKNGGLATLYKLQARYGSIETLTAETGSGGFHFYFQNPEGQWKSSANQELGIDTRFNGGFVVAPPSIHISGKHYQWVNESKPIVPILPWLASELSPKKTFSTPAYLPMKFRQGSAPGRVPSLLSLAGKLQRDGMLYPSVLLAFNSECCEPPLDEEEVLGICKRVLSKPIANQFAPTTEDLSPSVERWVREWLSKREAALSYKTGNISINGEVKRPAELQSRLSLDAAGWAERKNAEQRKKSKDEKESHPRFNDKDILHTLNLWNTEAEKSVVRAYQDKLAFDPAIGSYPIQQWVEAVTGGADKLDVAVTGHFVWQVKRKLHGLPVDDHMMLVLVGPSGGGKTRAIAELLSPIDELTHAAASMQVLDRAEEAYNFGKFYVVFFDEMGKAEKINVESLKNRITSSVVSYRVYYTQKTCTERNVSTFLGASNKEIRDCIWDPTSARRYWQMDASERLDWDVINSLDYLSLWKSVNHLAESPIKSLLDEIAPIQDEKIRNKTTLEEWIENETEFSSEKVSSSDELYSRYKAWCSSQELSAGGMGKFGRELAKTKGVHRTRDAGGTKYNLVVRKQAKPTNITSFDSVEIEKKSGQFRGVS